MGSVEPYQTAKGRRWRVRYRKPDGKTTDKRGFLTKNAAMGFLLEVESDKRRGAYIDPSAGKVLFGELAESWLASKVDLKPSTRQRHRHTLNGQVLPEWADVNVNTITARELQAWIGAMADRYSPSTVRKAYDCMSMVLDTAVRDRLIPANPATGLVLPRPRQSELVFLSLDELIALADAAGAQRGVILLLGLVGLRWGEMAALRVRRWSPSTRRLTISESVTEVDGEMVWGTPKNRRPRTVTVPAVVAEVLNEACAGKVADALIFTTESGAVMRNNNARRDWFDAAVRDSGVSSITPHDLRHTAASVAISVGANVKAVQRMLGHASAAMTLDVYAGLFQDDLDSVADRLDDAWAKSCGQNVGKLRVVGAE